MPTQEQKSTTKVFRVLFLSRRGSARGLMAEAVLNRLGQGRFMAYSAGVEPAKGIEPEALELLEVSGFDTRDLRPRHFAEFAKATAEPLDLVFTLSDTAAGEPMPEWPGLPVTSHWSYPDPVRATGEAWERKQAFSRVMKQLERRIAALVNLRPEALDRMSLQAHVDALAEAEAPHTA
jgi:protein-tyrosine-phosphatase